MLVRLARAGAGALVGAALLLSSCTSTQQAGSLPPTTRTAAASTTGLTPLGPADFPVPDAARVETADGATTFLKYYIELLSRAQQQLNSTGLLSLSEDCSICSQLADGLDYYSKKGYTVQGGNLTLNKVVAPKLDGVDAYLVLSLTQESATVRKADGEIDTKASITRVTYPGAGAILTWSSVSSSWLMGELTFNDPAK